MIAEGLCYLAGAILYCLVDALHLYRDALVDVGDVVLHLGTQLLDRVRCAFFPGIPRQDLDHVRAVAQASGNPRNFHLPHDLHLLDLDLQGLLALVFDVLLRYLALELAVL